MFPPQEQREQKGKINLKQDVRRYEELWVQGTGAKVSLKRDYLGKFPLSVSGLVQTLFFCPPPTVVVLREAQSGAQILLWAN